MKQQNNEMLLMLLIVDEGRWGTVFFYWSEISNQCVSGQLYILQVIKARMRITMKTSRPLIILFYLSHLGSFESVDSNKK